MALSIDCERVLCVGNREALAKVSIVDSSLNEIYSSFVYQENVLDYRKSITGIRPSDLKNALPEHRVKAIVKEILSGKIIVGHSLFHDFDCLDFYPPSHLVRDTQTYALFQLRARRQVMSLSHLGELFLNYDLKQARREKGYHCCYDDAALAMRLYNLVSNEWENQVKSGRYNYNIIDSREMCSQRH